MDNEDKILRILEQIQGDVKQIQGDVKQTQGDIKEMQGDMQFVKIQLKEHGEMLNSLKVASEFHKADIDNLTHQLVNISGELKAEIKETNLKIDKIAEDLNFVEAATGKNMTDIAYLKLAK
jgi:chromosome segregation ATPase